MLIDLLLSKNLPFVVYQLPQHTQPVFVVQTEADLIEFELEELDKQKGFVIATFDTYKSGKAYVLKASKLAKNEEESESLKKFLLEIPDVRPLLGEPENIFVSKASYLQQANLLIRQMKAGLFQKVVLSRVVEHRLEASFNHTVFFDRLQKEYPNAFVYMFFLPGKGLWAGASPETLIEKKDDAFETMALAGTQQIVDSSAVVTWQEKEMQEQAFVTEYIEAELHEMKLEGYKKSIPETILAGNLAHIRTRFQIPASVLKGRVGKLAKTLHPTPAVGGLPKDKACQMIEETERHHRDFYTGFLGPWNILDTQHLFVNLRCGQFFKNSLAVYVGGGLTAQSEAEKEWKETADKSTTLLSVVENLRNFAP